MAGITTAWGLAVLSPRPAAPRTGTCSYRLKPGFEHLSCGEDVTFSANKLSSRSPSLRVCGRISARLAQQLCRCLRQVFGIEHVSSFGQGSATWADFLHRKWPPARIPAAKKFLEIGLTIDVGCPLPLGSCGLGSTRHLRRACSEGIGACAFAAGEEVFRRRRDKCA